MSNMKFHVEDEKQSAHLQHILFAYGYDWEFKEYKGSVQPLDGSNYLYADTKRMRLYVAGVDECHYIELDTEAYIAAHEATPKEKPLEAPWVENTGEMPVPGNTLVDIQIGETTNTAGIPADEWCWELLGYGRITNLDIHNIEDYYTYPKTGYVPVDYSATVAEPLPNAARILEDAASILNDRAAERDKGAERAMSATVQAFNAVTGHALDEEQGWLFMVCLKAARSQGGGFKLDDYLDGAAYFALAGEAAAKSQF